MLYILLIPFKVLASIILGLTALICFLIEKIFKIKPKENKKSVSKIFCIWIKDMWTPKFNRQRRAYPDEYNYRNCMSGAFPSGLNHIGMTPDEGAEQRKISDEITMDEWRKAHSKDMD